MGRRKLLLTAAILFCANILVMVSEVAINQVLCCKSYGTKDVELAIFGFDCNCNHLTPHADQHGDHSHWEDSCLCKKESQMQKRQYYCLDIPLIGNWLFRDIQVLNYQFSLKTVPIIYFNPNANSGTFFGNLFELIPVSKFLYSKAIRLQSMILLC